MYDDYVLYIMSAYRTLTTLIHQIYGTRYREHNNNIYTYMYMYVCIYVYCIRFKEHGKYTFMYVNVCIYMNIFQKMYVYHNME